MVLVRVVDGSKSGVVEVWEMALDGVVGRRRVLAREGLGWPGVLGQISVMRRLSFERRTSCLGGSDNIPAVRQQVFHGKTMRQISRRR